MPYNENFIPGTPVTLPAIPNNLQNEIAPLKNGNGHVIDYFRHSVVMNKKRKLAFYSASNIWGKKWKKIDRKGGFKKEQAIDEDFQLGEELYEAIVGTGLRPNDFEQGHLTSFQEVLWGTNDTQRKKAAADTFFYTNCVPQHERVNSGLWRSLEQYVLKTETINHDLKVTVITGPLLSDKDPWYIEKINGEFVKIPCVFWKVIYYPNNNGLNAVGFMMSHKQLVVSDGTVTFDKGDVLPIAAAIANENYFMDYKYNSVYQVKVEFIQQETGLGFMLQNVNLPFQDNVKKDVLYKRIEVDRTLVQPGLAALRTPDIDFRIEGITL